MTDYKPAVGDRVRATSVQEGVVVRNIDDVYYPRVEIQAEEGLIELHDDDRWSFEKLSDPEPKWVLSDVIKVPGGPGEAESYTCFLTEAGWKAADGGGVSAQWVSRQWLAGTLKILYKADAA